MPPVIAYDLARLFLGPLSISPRGIDRVDLALAKHFFCDADSQNIGILPTPWGVRGFGAGMVRKGLTHLQELWSERRHQVSDPLWHGLSARLRNEKIGAAACPLPSRKALSKFDMGRRMATHLWHTGISIGTPISLIPKGAIYLNAGQIGLSVPALHRWLSIRTDITVACLLHDTIPLEFPHFVSASAVDHHNRVMQTTAKHANLIITTTYHARERIMATMAELGRPNIRSHVQGLPVPESLATARSPDPILEGCRYFVTCSTVEPRKNHSLLIGLWKTLVARLADRAPHLVIVGALGPGSANILEPLGTEPNLASRVHHVAGLSSPALASLMLSATGMLCPSRAEGFGLSVLEANALGVPTIASDIPAHREVANAETTLLAPDDLQGWLKAILSCRQINPQIFSGISPSLSEKKYSSAVEEFLFSANLKDVE